MRRISLSSNTIQRRISGMLEDVKDQVINDSISNVFFSSGWFNRCCFMCSVTCFRERYSFSRHLKWSFYFVRNCKLQQQVEMFLRSKSFFILQSCSGNIFVGFVLMELLQWWDHVQAFKKVQELAPEAKGIHCVIHRCALASRTLPAPLKNVMDSTIKILSITWNLEALPAACLKNSAKTCFWQTKFFYCTCLYAGCWKETFYNTFLRWRTE